MIKSKKRCLKELLLDPSFFRIIYFITLFAVGISFIDIFAYTLNCINLIWALIISINLIMNKKLKNIKYRLIIILFLLVTILTALLHIGVSFIDDYRFNFIYSLVYTFHAFICFFIFYGMYSINSLAEIEDEMFFIFKIILILTTIATLVGFSIFLIQNEIILKFPFENLPQIFKDTAEPEYILGIVQKDTGVRFEGIFTNPNIMAFYCSVSLVFCHILLVSKKFFKIKSKALLFITISTCVIANFIALILSDSYASFIFLIVYVICNLFYKIVASGKNSSAKNYVFKSLIFILAGTFFTISLLVARNYFQNGASDVISEISSFTSSSDINIDKNEYDIKFGRPNHDLSSGSGRKILLKQAYVILKNNFIIGVGPTNLLYYGQKYFESGLIFPNFHNGYVSILVSYGIIGFALFMLFLILVFSNLLLLLFKNNKILNKVYPLLFSVLVSYLVFALFEKTMLSENNFMCAFFWLMLGYATTYAFNTNFFMNKEKNKTVGEYK